MNLEIPEVPAGILTLLSFFAPYVIALINHPRWSSRAKKIVSITVPLISALLVWAIYFFMTGDGLYAWPQMVLLAVAVTQASYGLVTKKTATEVEIRTHPMSEDDFTARIIKELDEEGDFNKYEFGYEEDDFPDDEDDFR